MKKSLVKKTLLVVVLLSSVSLMGCVVGNTTTGHYHRSTTLGQELCDLKGAHKQGVVTDDEFEQAKSMLLNNVVSFKIEAKGSTDCCEK